MSRSSASGAWLFDRSSRPRRSLRLLDSELQERNCECRPHTVWGPRLVAGAAGQPHSTVWKVLHRHGISRPPRAPMEPANRYEWPCPGDLLHMDLSRYWRFERPGHAITGDRSQRSRNWMAPETCVGCDYAHAIIDDQSRQAYVVPSISRVHNLRGQDRSLARGPRSVGGGARRSGPGRG